MYVCVPVHISQGLVNVHKLDLDSTLIKLLANKTHAPSSLLARDFGN